VTTIEERVAHLEGRLAEQSEMFVDLRTGLSNLAGRVDQLEQSMNRRFDQVDARFAPMDARFAQMEARFVQIDARFVQSDARNDARFVQIDRRFLQIDDRFTQVDGHVLQVASRVDRLGDETATHFRWIVGVQITTAMTVIAALIGALAVR
jgi:uncharacterized coiled-coil protein SlyX